LLIVVVGTILNFVEYRQRRGQPMTKGETFMLVVVATLAAYAVAPMARRAGVPV